MQLSARPEMLAGPVRLFSDGTRILIPAVQDKSVGWLICVTGFGAGDSRLSMGCLQLIPFRMFLGRARYRVLDEPGSWRNGLVSRANVVDFIVRQIDDDAYVGTASVLVY